MVRYDQINIDAPVSDAFRQVGLPWAELLVSVGAVAGITSVLLVMMLSQPRIFLAMARDGLLPPKFFAAVHERFRTPWKSTILTGICVALMGAFLPLRILAELVNIGTLLAFVIVCAAVLIMRRTQSRSAPAVSGAVRPRRSRAGDSLLLAADVLAACRKLGAPFRLAGGGPGDLLRLRAQAQRHGPARRGRGPGAPPHFIRSALIDSQSVPWDLVAVVHLADDHSGNDAAGNSTAEGSYSYTYDAENRISRRVPFYLLQTASSPSFEVGHAIRRKPGFRKNVAEPHPHRAQS